MHLLQTAAIYTDFKHSSYFKNLWSIVAFIAQLKIVLSKV